MGDWRAKSRTPEEGSSGQRPGHYFKTFEDLRAQIFARAVGNARIALQTDNARLAADDLRVKYETELATCQCLESAISGP